MADFLLNLYFEIPPITRVYVTACALTSIVVQMKMVSPLQLYFSLNLIVNKFQVWRIITPFLFFGPPGVSLLIYLIQITVYSQYLEQHNFHNRSADFLYLYIFGGAYLTLIAGIQQFEFMGKAFMSMLVYIWSRKNPEFLIDFNGLVVFPANFFAVIMFGWSLIFLTSSEAAAELSGILVGHAYWYLTEFLPQLTGKEDILRTPDFIKRLFA